MDSVEERLAKLEKANRRLSLYLTLVLCGLPLVYLLTRPLTQNTDNLRAKTLTLFDAEKMSMAFVSPHGIMFSDESGIHMNISSGAPSDKGPVVDSISISGPDRKPVWQIYVDGAGKLTRVPSESASTPATRSSLDPVVGVP